MQLTHN